MNHHESGDPFAGSSTFANSFEGGLAMGAERFNGLGLEAFLDGVKDSFGVSSGDVLGCVVRHPFDPFKQRRHPGGSAFRFGLGFCFLNASSPPDAFQ